MNVPASFVYLLSFVPAKEPRKILLRGCFRVQRSPRSKEKLSQLLSSTFFLLRRQKKEPKKTSPAYNITAKNLLERASLDKLLASLVGQYLRSPFSYGFINAVNCNAGLKEMGE